MTHIPRSGGLAGGSERSGLAARLSGKRILCLLLLAVSLLGIGLFRANPAEASAQPFFSPKFRAFDANGLPLAGGLLFSYAAGTSTPLATYTTELGNVSNSNPVVLDANGQADVWTTPGVFYKFVLENSSGVVQWTVDNFPSPPSLNVLPNGTVQLPDGTANSPALQFINDTDTGIRRVDAGIVGMVANSSDVGSWSDTYGLQAVATSGNNHGVQGTGKGTGAGVRGLGGDSNGSGVYGTANGTGAGVYGESATGNGVEGHSLGSTSGVVGFTPGSAPTAGKYAAVAGYSDGGVTAAYFEAQGTGVGLEVNRGGIKIGGDGSVVGHVYLATQAINDTVAGNTCHVPTSTTVTGAATGGVCMVSPAGTGGNASSATWTCTVAASNTVNVELCNTTGSSLTFTPTVNIAVIQP